MSKQTKKERNKRLTALACLLAADLIFLLTLWLLRSYDEIRPDQFLYQFKTSMAGTSLVISLDAVAVMGGGTLALLAAQLGLYRLLAGRWQQLRRRSRLYLRYCAVAFSRFFRRRALALSAALLCISALVLIDCLNVFAYAAALVTESDFIADNYADPDAVELTFPQQKRNLIYIYLESMENTYGDASALGQDYIPELTALARENVSFSHSDGLGGALSYTGTTWTAAAMVAQTAGVPVKVSLVGDELGGEDPYMPGCTTLGDILDRAGYEQVLLLGSDASFANREAYFTEHGDYTIVDIDSLKAEGRLEQDYYQWWGYEDEKLFAYAREELTALAGRGEPFNFTLLTADTHFPDGYFCRLCGDEHDRQYANVLACSSRQVEDFVQWIRQQPFYANTTIVLCGDHLTMDPEFLEGLDEGYTRTIYNCIINAAVEPVCTTQRQFAVFDLFPTTLSAMGVTIGGDRLGLGTDLFSATATLTEAYGYDYLEWELQKNSAYYEQEIYEEG